MKLLRNIKNKYTALLDMYCHKTIEEIKYEAEAVRLKDKTFNLNDRGISQTDIKGKKLIVSLTTYGKRFYEVHTTIESIMQQSLKPNKIILWLQEDLKNSQLPITLKLQEKRGLEIRFCKDIRSYKKLIYTLKEYPNDIIVTIDDDVIYRFDMLENMVNAYLEDPKYIYGNRVKEIRVKGNKILPYNSWKIISAQKEHSKLYFATGVGGILYPPDSLDEEVFNEKVFSRICPNADDIWFKAMALKRGTFCKTINLHSPVYIENQSLQESALYNINVNENFNDKQLLEVFKYYNLFDKLR